VSDELLFHASQKLSAGGDLLRHRIEVWKFRGDHIGTQIRA
jgi:hypothetical protein